MDARIAIGQSGGMRGSTSLERRLEAYAPARAEGDVVHATLAAAHTRGLHGRIQATLDDAISVFELDRMLYDIEVEALNRWLRSMMAFDAFCARRDAETGDGSSDPSVP